MASERQRRARRGRDNADADAVRRKHRAAIQSGRATNRFRTTRCEDCSGSAAPRQQQLGADEESESFGGGGQPMLFRRQRRLGRRSSLRRRRRDERRRRRVGKLGRRRGRPEPGAVISGGGTAGLAGTGSGKAAAEAYLGRAISAGEYNSLMRATHAKIEVTRFAGRASDDHGHNSQSRPHASGGVARRAEPPRISFQAVDRHEEIRTRPEQKLQTGAKRSETGFNRKHSSGFAGPRADKPNRFSLRRAGRGGPGTNMGYLAQLQGTGGAAWGGTRFGGPTGAGGAGRRGA